MGDDGPRAERESVESGAGADPEAAEEKAKGRPRRSTPYKPLPTTDAGDTRGEQLRKEASDLVLLAATTEARRRRATAIDAADYERGFDQVAGPPRLYRIVDLVADLAGALGSGLIGYAINVYTGGASGAQPGHIAMLGGAALTAAGIALKYARRAG